MTAALVTGASYNDPTGGWSKVNFSKRSSSESGQGPKADRPITTSETLDTQRPQMAHNDQGRVLY